jgi:uncharacterized membrane protein YfcA
MQTGNAIGRVVPGILSDEEEVVQQGDPARRKRPRTLQTRLVYEWSTIALASIGVLFIGLSKAGFGGGLGMLTTPLCVLAFTAHDRSPAFAIGTLLPLLCIGDAFSLYHYRGKGRKENLGYLLPGVVIGVILGVQLIDRFSPRQLNVVIGLFAVSFVIFQFAKNAIFKAEGSFAPSHKLGIPFGIAAGVTSSFAHGAGPVVSMFLIPQRLPKEAFVGSMALIFTWINWIKMPFFVWKGFVTLETLRVGLLFVLLVPAGVWLGVLLNRRVSETLFSRLVYLFTFIAGVQLLFNFNWTHLLK